MVVKKVTYFGEFGYLNSSCIRKSIISMFLNSSRDKFTFFFLLVSGRHVGAHPYGHMQAWL